MNEDFNRDEKDLQEEIHEEFAESMKKGHNTKMSTYFLYAFLFVVILIIFAITSTYAYFDTSIEDSRTEAHITATAECFDVVLNDGGQTNGSLNLQYNYPITDAFALADSNITPYTITVTNKCTSEQPNASQTGIKYSLVLVTLGKTNVPEGEVGYIGDDKIRYNIKKDNADFKGSGYLSTMDKLQNTVEDTNEARDLLANDLIDNEANNSINIKDYDKATYYLIETSTIAPGATVTYKVYLWVDYYEGDSKMYNKDNVSPHDTNLDKSTEGKQFKAFASLVIN